MGEDEKKRIEEYQKALDADDAEDVAKGKLFDPRDLLLEAKAMRQKYHKKLGLVNYGVLTIDELFELNKMQDKNESSKVMLWMMLHKAYSDLKKEDIGRFPGVKAAELLKLISKEADFLPAAPKSLKSGSKTTRTRK